MLTGRPAFGGEDVTITLARILERETDLSALPATVPDALRHTIELCLRKDPRKRIADIRDVKLALEGALQRDSGATQLSAGTRSAWRRALPIAATALIATCTTALIAWTTLQPEPEPVRWFDYYLPAGQGFRNGGRPVLTLSPDGSAFAFNTLGGIFLRRLDNLEAELIPGTELSLASPAFSAD
jgi:hypothetical protein